MKIARYLIFIFVFVLPSNTYAQPATGTQIADFLTIDAESRIRYELMDNFDFNKNTNDHNNMVFMRSRLGFTFDMKKHVSMRLQLQDFRRWGDFNDTTGGNSSNLSDRADLTLREGYIDLLDLWDNQINIRLGRQPIFKGEERVFTDLDWNNIGLTHDAATMSYKPKAKQKYDLIFIAVEENDNQFNTSTLDDDAYLWSLYSEFDLKPFTKFEPYYIFQDYDSATLANHMPQVTSSGAAGDDAQIHTLGLLATGNLGSRFNWGFEGNYQFGKFGTYDLTGAYLLHGKLGYKTGWNLLDRFDINYDVYSGDRNSSDREINTYQPIFPYFYKHMGLIRWFAMKNMNVIKLSTGGNLGKKWQWDLDWYRFQRERREDDIFDAVTKSRTGWLVGVPSDDIGQTVDLFLTYPWKDNVTFTNTYSYIFAGKAVEQGRANGNNTYGGVLNIQSQIEVNF